MTYKHSQHLIFFLVLFLFVSKQVYSATSEDISNSFRPGQVWKDNNGKHINAHGGGILFHEGKYYWFGEHRAEKTFTSLAGVACYSSTDLYNWQQEDVALSVVDNKKSPITKGCIIERPKVIYNKTTKQFVMYFHLELKGKGYEAAHFGMATSDKVTGPYKFIKSSRVNAKHWPMNMTDEQIKSKETSNQFKEWWTPQWRTAIEEGLFVRRDYKGGQMSRDMTLFVDDDDKAYHIYSSEDNLTLQIAELSDNYLKHTGNYIRIEPGGHNEAPAIFKKDGRYFMITSGCTGWEPNEARLLVADHIMGEWKRLPNPCVGEKANRTFNSQSTYILPIIGKKDTFIFMADGWNPKNLIDSRYIWLPISFKDGLPVLKWMDNWNMNVFDQLMPDSNKPGEIEGWNLAWNDEFNGEGRPDPSIWKHEKGFSRNEELQWYQPDNAVCGNGVLSIHGKKEQVPNPNYTEDSPDWKKNRKQAEYTASLVKTNGTKEFQYGRFEVRAKIPTSDGAWPAIWTLGSSMEWPSNGEIDIMEYYRINGEPNILANVAWGTEKQYNAKWASSAKPFTYFTGKDPHWADKFHIWRMDWDEETIRLYVDDELLNEIPLSKTINGSLGEYKNPFKQPHYLLLNLAIGGINGGKPDDTAFPIVYEIDYVRVYQKK